MKKIEEILKNLVCFKTVAASGENDSAFEKCFEYLKKTFPLCFSGEVTRVGKGFILKIKGKGSGKPSLLMAHMDVVGASKTYTTAFNGQIKDDKVWGRGCVDTKGTLVCTLFALEEFLLSKTPQNDLYFLSTANEEFSGEDGAKAAKIFKDRGMDFSLVLDEGGAIMTNPMAGVEGEFAMIALSERGAKKFLVFDESKQKAENIGKFLVKASKMKLASPKFSPEVLSMFKTLCPHMRGVMKFVFSNLWLCKGILKSILPKISEEAKAMVMPTLSVSNSSELSGKQFGVSLTVNFTYNFDENSLEDKIKKLAKKCRVCIETISSREAVTPSSIQTKQYKMVENTVKESFTAVTPCPFILFGGTDSRAFTDISESVLRFAPIKLSARQFKSFHNDDENIDISALNGAVNFYKNLIEKL